MCVCTIWRRRDSSAGTATAWMARVRFQTMQKLSFPHSIQTVPGAYSASYLVRSRGSVLGGKAAGA
jgi:hypothetical protein